MKLQEKAFTIVELLVVISIIGILTAVILTSLNDARKTGIDAKVLSEIDSITKRAAIEQNQSFIFDSVCGSNGITQSSVISGLIVSINTLASSTAVCNSDTSEYAISVALTNVHWCVDSTGARKEIPAALDASPPASDFSCP